MPIAVQLQSFTKAGAGSLEMHARVQSIFAPLMQESTKEKRWILVRLRGIKKSPVAVPAFRMRDKFQRMRVINSEDVKSQEMSTSLFQMELHCL